jgi:hypothetical protein
MGDLDGTEEVDVDQPDTGVTGGLGAGAVDADAPGPPAPPSRPAEMSHYTRSDTLVLYG